MPADFINAYLLGNAGATGSNNGACASFLYNLRMALDDIRSGRRKLVLTGNSEAPLIPGIVEGFNAMGALATEERLQKLEGLNNDQQPDFRRASRPFAQNVGFTLAESAQCFVLTSRDTALELGLNILGSIGDVFIHADGYKRSISAPGIGNYITMGKAMASAKRTLSKTALGDTALQKSFVQAHGSSTPQNRTTESDMFNRLAKEFGISEWPVCAVKAHLGHSISAASADQLLMTLGSWNYGVLPGITTASEIAPDVQQSHLTIPLSHTKVSAEDIPVCFINSKGFGGNNASAWILSGQASREHLKTLVTEAEWHSYIARNEKIRESQQQYLSAVAKENLPLPYRDKEAQPEPDDIELSAEGMKLPGWAERVRF
jgi:acetoacetyl-[acyl-carrier protein] synthase